MTDEEALSFLRTVQPLPDDHLLTEDLIKQFDRVRSHFVKSSSESAVPLFLNSFGNGSGLGVYQLVEDALAGVESTKVVEYLAPALSSHRSSVRYWTAQISANYNDDRLVHPLLILLRDDDRDIRMAALTSVEKYIRKPISKEFQDSMQAETDPEIVEVYHDILSSLD